MTTQELSTLRKLLFKLQDERLQQYRDAGYDISNMEEELIYSDSADRLLQAIDTIFCEI
jgi:transcription initiation factor IIE alpha subunit